MNNLNEEEKKAISELLHFDCAYNKEIKTALNLIEKQQEKLQEKDKIINDAIIRIENLRQYFDDGCQADFIEILEILKNKSVIDW